MMKRCKTTYWGKGDHSDIRFDLCTVYGYIQLHIQVFLASFQGRLSSKV